MEWQWALFIADACSQQASALVLRWVTSGTLSCCCIFARTGAGFSLCSVWGAYCRSMTAWPSKPQFMCMRTPAAHVDSRRERLSFGLLVAVIMVCGHVSMRQTSTCALHYEDGGRSRPASYDTRRAVRQAKGVMRRQCGVNLLFPERSAVSRHRHTRCLRAMSSMLRISL